MLESACSLTSRCLSLESEPAEPPPSLPTMTALCLVLALAQGPTASLHGTVRDSETGAAVEGATVELLDANLRSLTDERGGYLLERAPTGPRHLRVGGLGYKPVTLHVFVPAEGPIRVDVALLPEPIPLQPVEATVDFSRSAGAARDSDRDLQRVGSKTVSYDAVRAHPGLAEPDFFEALAGGGVQMDPEAPNGLHVRGGAADHNLFTLDGIPIYSPYHGAGRFSAVGADAISRVQLHAGVPPVALGDALAGVVEIRTRRPDAERIGFRGALTPTGASLTADGPLGLGAGFLLSGSWGQPGFIAPKGEDSYLLGSFSNGLAKLERALAGGHLWILGFQSASRLGAANLPTSSEGSEAGDATDVEPAAVAVATTNRFSWHSSSYGVGWKKPVADLALLDAQLWYADLVVSADWWAVGSPYGASNRRRTLGSRVRLTVDGESARSLFGWSLEQERMKYAVRPMGAEDTPRGTEALFSLRTEPMVFAAFVEHQRRLLRTIQLLLGVRASGVSGEPVRFAPRISLRWPMTPSFALSAGYARTHQWAQSLRNPESLIDNLLSPDLPIGVGAAGVPAARADQVTVALNTKPASGLHVELEGFSRRVAGLVLVAPSTGQPFAVGAFSIGVAEIRGIGLNAELEGARYRALASYGFSEVSHEAREREYRPGYASSHSLSTGVVYYPGAQFELRSFLRSELGRRTTLMEGPFGWEACSFLEGGCEAEGSPAQLLGPIGGSRLPAYVRVDIGVRKHWHWRALGRDGVIGAFTTLSNVFRRKNVLGYVSDPDSGEVSPLPMRPLSLLTAGLDWRF